MSDADATPTIPRWQWVYRLLRVTAMIVAAYWLSRTGEAFFYQGF